ncbi:efflux RND transporter periplasmic adaptor subunit [Guyparkeria sp. GHLCS8-2]|uniref:efflux RND transporter periplasmic adaptor subunit n=1 Tax=Guyparkeria halopsychrophila TaxID=3139421 RepID=UPI0037CAE9FE
MAKERRLFAAGWPVGFLSGALLAASLLFATHATHAVQAVQAVQAAQGTEADDVEGAAETLPVVLVAPVRAGVDARPALVGAVVAKTASALGFQVAGRISERLVRRGERVESDAVLARLDDRDLRARLDSARSALAQAQAEATLTDQELGRIRDLSNRNVASRQQLDQAISRQRAAAAAMSNAEARLTEAKNALDYAELRAPFDGVLTGLLADVGDVVAAGQPMLQLAADAGRLVEVAVPERRMPTLSEGAMAELVGDGQTVAAKLDSVSGAADPASRTYAARYRLNGAAVEGQPWSLGQTAILRFAGGEPTLRVPVGAVFARDGQSRVFRVQDDAVQAVAVTVRSVAGDYAVIAGDLPVGALVVAAGVNRLHDGQRVRPRRAAELAGGAGEPRP